MQSRVSEIGLRLIPAYQKSLASDDPTRINFRFYVVDAPGTREAFVLPSGIVLVPRQVVELMENDSQMAAILSDKIVRLIEQPPIQLPATNGQIEAKAAIFAGFGLLGLAGYEVGSSLSARGMEHRNQEQRARVGLGLMHDAGFDVVEAPKAWWILSLKEGKDMAKSNPPETVVYMYGVVAERLAAADLTEKTRVSEKVLTEEEFFGAEFFTVSRSLRVMKAIISYGAGRIGRV